MEKELIKKDTFMFYCSELSIDTVEELGEEIIVVNPMKEHVIAAYRQIMQYLIPFAIILDKDDAVTFIISNSGDKDLSEIIYFVNSLSGNRIKWNASKWSLSEYFPNIKGYRGGRRG